VYGGDAAIEWVRAHAAPGARVISYPHRVSAALVLAERTDELPDEAARAVATAVALFDQRGCVSPHTVYVVSPDPTLAERFAAGVADAMMLLDQSFPPGVPQFGEASAFHQAAGSIELEAASSDTGVRVHGLGTRWRVVYEPREGFRGSCLGRFVWIRPVASVEEAAAEMAPLRREIQTIGVWGRLGGEALERLARLGVRRIAPIEGAPWPTARTRHDGVAPLRSLVRWVEVDD